MCSNRFRTWSQLDSEPFCRTLGGSCVLLSSEHSLNVLVEDEQRNRRGNPIVLCQRVVESPRLLHIPKDGMRGILCGVLYFDDSIYQILTEESLIRRVFSVISVDRG